MTGSVGSVSEPPTMQIELVAVHAGDDVQPGVAGGATQGVDDGGGRDVGR